MPEDPVDPVRYPIDPVLGKGPADPVRHPVDPVFRHPDDPIWTPKKKFKWVDDDFIDDTRYRQLHKKLRKKKDTSSTAPAPSGAPLQIRSVTATESPIKVGGQTYSLVSVSFIRDPADKNYASTRIWMQGYHGNT